MMESWSKARDKLTQGTAPISMRLSRLKLMQIDRFFTQQHCDRCHGDLKQGRIMSMFNTQCICMNCAEAERKREDYKDALEADREQIKKGNRNFKGIGLKK